MSTEERDAADLTDDELEALENATTGEPPETVPEETEEDEAEDKPADDAPESEQQPEDVSEPKVEPEQKTEGESETKPPKIEGVASKNGKHVLPYHVLQAERRRADKAAERARELEAELEDLKAGKKPEESAELTEEEVAQMEQDFPDHGKKLRAMFEMAQKAKDAVKAAPKASEPEERDDPIQEAIDQVPMLVSWQFGDPEKFQRAQVLDDVLRTSPKWKDKPLQDRFAQVVKLVAEEYDIPMDEQPTTDLPKPKTTATDPAKVIANATRAKPNTLSDFKGGTTPETPSTNFERLSPTAQVNRWGSMTDDEIDAALARSGG